MLDHIIETINLSLKVKGLPTEELGGGVLSAPPPLVHAYLQVWMNKMQMTM